MARKKYGMMLGLLGGLATTTTFAQDSKSTSDDWLWDSSKVSSSNLAQHNAWLANQTPYPARPKDKLELGIGVGMSNLISTPIDSRFGYGASISLRKALGHVVSLRAQYGANMTYGQDYRLRNTTGTEGWLTGGAAGSYNPWAQYDGKQYLANYNTLVQQAALDAIFSINTISNYRGDPKVNFYALTGYSYNWAKVRVNALDANGKIYDWANSGIDFTNGSRKDIRKAVNDILHDGQKGNGLFSQKGGNDKQYESVGATRNGSRDNATGSGGYNGASSINRHAIDLGGGIAFHITNNFNIGIEQKFTFFLSNSDVLSGLVMGPQGRNTALSATQVRFNFNLGSSAKRIAPLWWVNPNNYIYNELNVPKHMKISLPDADGDGVTDAFDLEPNTPAGAPVDSHGRALDTDGDGVPDYKDKQKITPQSWFPVDADGVGTEPEPACCKELRDKLANYKPASECAITSLPSVQFSKGSVKLSKAAQASLATVAAQLNANPGCKIKVIGYGASNKKAQQLSWDRVNSVIKYLVEKQGISEGRLLFYYGQDGDANTVDLQGTTEEGPNTVPAPHPNLQKTK